MTIKFINYKKGRPEIAFFYSKIECRISFLILITRNMNNIQVVQAQPILETQSRNLPLAEVVAQAEQEVSTLTNNISIDLSKYLSVPSRLLTIAMDDPNVDSELKKLVFIRYWQDLLKDTVIVEKKQIDDIIHMIFHMDILSYKIQLYNIDTWKDYEANRWADPNFGSVPKPKYLILIGMESRSALVWPNLYIDYTKKYIKEHYNGLMMQLFIGAWEKRETHIHVEMGFARNNNEVDSLHPYSILIKKSMLKQILVAIKSDIKIVVTDRDSIDCGGRWEEVDGVKTCLWSSEKVEYKPSPSFGSNNITFNKTEEYSTITSFVEPYVKFQIDWGSIRQDAVVLL
jgi:hypothetical protein